MHPNPVFRSHDWAMALVMARKRGFGILTVNGPEGIMASHLPFVAETTTIDAHVPRSNAIGRVLRDGPLEALLIVSGPDGYISPDWYGAEEQVPTWNYVAVHIRGEVAIRPEETLRAHLDQLTDLNEARLDPKPRWTLDKNSEEGTAKLMRMLVPLRMTIKTIDATWKLNQNRTGAMREGAADSLAQTGFGHNPVDLADLMRTWKDE